jgi:hypothetical protein
MRILLRVIALLCLCAAASMAASPAQCWAVHNITTLADWNTPAYWASGSGGTGGTCAATGGASVAWHQYTATTLAAGVPGCAACSDSVVVDGSAGKAFTVHIAAGLGISLGSPANAWSTMSLVVNGTSSTVYGSAIIDDQGFLIASGSYSYGQISNALWGVFQVMPGGTLQLGPNSTASNNNGRWYVGCGDQTKYGTSTCTAVGNAGSWVTAHVAGTLNITSTSTLPLLNVGDLVELAQVQQPTKWGYPYTAIDNVTPPPRPPLMPVTNDTGTTANTCGSLATCLVPSATLLCTVAVSGTSVSLGWPQGGTTADPYCTGAETAMAITDPGFGQLWLSKPAFMWGPPSNFAWTTSRSKALSAWGAFDPIYSIQGLDYAPISNAAHNGPGRPGDNSLTFVAPNWGTGSCTKLNFWDVVANTCYVDYDYGILVANGFNFNFSGTANYYSTAGGETAALDNNIEIKTPTGTSAGNELLISNTDIRYAYNNYDQSGIQFKGYSNAANNRAVFQHNVVAMSSNVVGDYGVQGTLSAPFEVTYNAVVNNASLIGNADAFITGVASGQYLDASHNWFKGSGSFLSGGNYAHTATYTHSHYTLTNNIIWALTVALQGMYADDVWPYMLLQQNRIIQGGNASVSGSPNYSFAISSLHNYNASAPITVRNNVIYGAFREAALEGNTTFEWNFMPYFFHHGVCLTAQQPYYGVNANTTVRNNILLANESQPVTCIDSFQDAVFLDSPVVRGNTCIGMMGGADQGDMGDGGSTELTANLSIQDNVFALPYEATYAVFMKHQLLTMSMTQQQVSTTGNNASQGTAKMYLPVESTNFNSIPNPEYNRHVLVTKAGSNYNTSVSKNVTGTAIQNPSYAVNKTGGALQLVVVSPANMTLAWSVDGTNYGTPLQLNWGGSGTTYTVATVTDPGAAYPYTAVTVSGTPFIAQITPGAWANTGMPVTSPASRWALMTGGAMAGSAYPIFGAYGTAGSATGQLYIGVPIPHPTLAATDTFVIVASETGGVTPSEVHLFDAGGTDYVDVGIDARLLPTAAGTYTDTGIAITITDYCASGCGAASVLAGLQMTDTPGSSYLPLNPVTPPWFGGSAEEAFNKGYFEPSRSNPAWKTAGSTGGPVGAITPKVIWQQPAGMSNWPGVY